MPRGFRRGGDAALDVPAGQSRNRFVGVAIEEDAQVEKTFRAPVTHQHVEAFDDDERRFRGDPDGTGLRVFGRVVEGGEHSAAGAAKRGHVGAEALGVEGVRRAAAAEALGVETRARNVVAVHGDDDRAGDEGGESVRERALSTARDAGDADHGGARALL